MKKIMRFFMLALLLVGSIGLMTAGAIVWFAFEDLPDLEALKNYQPPQSTIVFDRHGQTVGRFFDERRTVISLKKLPHHVKYAFIAAEDADFFEHRGIDYLGLLRAVGLEIRYRTIGGRRVGGSTITQQTARTMLLSSKQTYVRKIKEIVLAKRIEDALSKDDILHLYLNQIYFGNGAYGIEEAAQTYFQKPASKLTLFEAAALASVPKSPNRINPFSDADRLKVRQHYVLDQMVKHSFVNEKDAIAAKNAPLFSDVADGGTRAFAPYFLRAVKVELLQKISDEEIRRGGLKVYSTLDNTLQKHAEAALSKGLRALDKQNGYRGPIYRPEKGADVLKDKLEAFKKRAFIEANKQKIWDLSKLSKDALSQDMDQAVDSIRLTAVTAGKVIGARVVSINDRAQTAVLDLGSRTMSLPYSAMSFAHSSESTKKVAKKVSDIAQAGDVILVKIHGTPQQFSLSLEQEPQINGGIVALDVKTGGVLAMAGGDDFERSPFNRITQAKRQPGSGIKPLIYAQAIDQGLVTAASIITDAPKAFLDPGTNEYWRPRNHTKKYLGDITFRHCLRSSINTCTITLLERLGLDSFLQLAKDVELITPFTPFPRNLTLALGSAETYPINVANAMRVLANEGLYSPYHLMDALKPAGGKRQNVFEPKETKIFRKESAFIITNILKEVVSESKRATHLNNVMAELAGKTGTTNNARSTWFFGYSPDVLALVYVGFDDNRSIGSDAWGINTAFPIWAEFMNGVPAHQEAKRFAVPENIEWRMVDRASGRGLLSLEDETEPTGIMEAFIAGSAPEPTLDVHTRPTADQDEAAFAP